MLNDPDDISSNPSENRPFDEVLDAYASRRTVLKGGLVGAAAFMGGTALYASPAAAHHKSGGTKGGWPSSGNGKPDTSGPTLGFTAIATGTADTVVVPEGYKAEPILAWGEPINGRYPQFKQDASNTGEEQEKQLGQGHDGIWYFPLSTGWSWWRRSSYNSSFRGLIAINHEYTLGELTFPDGSADWDAEKTRKEQAGHGVSVVEVIRTRQGWRIRPSYRARRITPNTPAKFSGPAAGHRLLKTNNDPTGTRPVGTVNNCGNGYTPWGTYITCEENFNGYFWMGDDPAVWEREGSEEEFDQSAEFELVTSEQAEMNRRYGVGQDGFGYQWASTDDTFRADLDPQRPNTYGWIVEIDPYNRWAAPVKRTALGRFKHEGFAFGEGAKGEAVAYMGDDQRFDYVYKFVGAKPWKEAIRQGESPLDEGTLYVARYDDDGTGEWLPLVHGEGPLDEKNGFADQGEVLIKARMAADLLGATPMDRPEWTTVDLRNGDAYCTFTNNTRRGEDEVDAANPRGPNRDGHIIRWNEGDDRANTSFEWELFIVAGGRENDEGVVDDGNTLDAEDVFGSPDGMWLDPFGVLWIQTDGGQPDGSNNQMLACDPETGELRRFLVGPVDCEVTGATMTPDGKTLFINIQHPGDSGDSENPTATSTWPDGEKAGRPRPATVAISRIDGGRVGS